ncbi:MAG: ABC transporter ATP-binding protein [Candidatus Omnitrophica bacterium]|nr:ABC transporter ATP-binding protein [Candidatus Omnitrophota bacterium]
MKSVLLLDNVGVVYRGAAHNKEALRGLSLEISGGEIFGFLGPNGAGKTTTIKAILNLLFPDQGRILLFGEPNDSVRARRRLGYMPELANYYWYLTPRELLLMYAGFFGMPKKSALKKIEALCERVGLAAEADVLMKFFSKGMMQKVSLAQALINDPDILVLDEPTSGLDPIARINVRDIINEVKSQGKTVFFSSHELSEVELVCDRVGILHEGRLIKSETTAAILHEKGQQRSLETYFTDLIMKKNP